MLFTKEERIGLLLIGVSMLVGGILLNRKEEMDLTKLKNAALKGNERDSLDVGLKRELERRVDINSASFDELLRIPGIGPKTASLILEYRRRKKFSTIEELKEIQGIGDKKLQKLKRYIEVR